MAIVDRLASFLAGTGATIQRAAGLLRSPTVTPQANLPGVALPLTATPKNQNERLLRDLLGDDAYLGRISTFAGPSATRFSSYPATDLTPEKISGAQQEALAGYPLRWSEMIEQIISRDAHLAGIAQQRVDDVVKGTWRLVRSVNDPVADAVRSFNNEALRGVDELDDAFAWLLWGNAYCYNATETTWKRSRLSFPGPKGETLVVDDAVVPSRMDAVHPKHFRFDLQTDEPLLWIGGDQISLPFGKFMFYRGEGQHPITERRGYMWQCAWLSMFKSIGWAGWAVYVERFGLPTPLIFYDGTIEQYNEHKTLYEQILQWIGRGYGAIAPNGTKIEFAKAEGAGRSSDPHSAISVACDTAQSIRILGATLTTTNDGKGSYAATTQHMDVKYAREEADARRLWAVVRPQLLTPITVINAEAIARTLNQAGYSCTPDMIVRRVPRGLHRVPREIDPIQRMNMLSLATNDLGMPIGMEAIYDELNLPQPMGPADVAPGRPQQVTSGGKVVGSVEASTKGAEAPKEDTQKEAQPQRAESSSAGADDSGDE